MSYPTLFDSLPLVTTLLALDFPRLYHVGSRASLMDQFASILADSACNEITTLQGAPEVYVNSTATQSLRSSLVHGACKPCFHRSISYLRQSLLVYRPFVITAVFGASEGDLTKAPFDRGIVVLSHAYPLRVMKCSADNLTAGSKGAADHCDRWCGSCGCVLVR